jgi:hypothetical protein
MVGAARTGGEGTIALGAPIGILACYFGLGFFGGPPDEPECAEDGDLQHNEQKENGPEPLHAASVPTADGTQSDLYIHFESRRRSEG